mmetsp:Transcript_25286/g.40710  ORF Transcript_25286/g.40710 Transcript_25286/m.40710 type:complete len:97 (+) Transcript_25286:483-773(+)
MEEAWNKKGCFVVKDASSWVSAHGKMWTRLSQNATTEGTHRGWEYELRLSQWNIALDHYGEGVRDSKTTAVCCVWVLSVVFSRCVAFALCALTVVS